MNWLQTKYAYLLSTNLRNFKRKGNNLYNFSCPLCGDSKKDKRKARGYLYESGNGNLTFKCHNCNQPKSFDQFLQLIDSDLYKQYRREVFKEKNPDKQYHEKKEETILKNELKIENYVIKASDNSEAFGYIQSRHIPKDKISGIYYTDDLSKLKEIFKNPNYDKIKFYPEPRLVLPVYTINNSLLGIITRSLNPNSNLRYINLRTISDEPFIYNLTNVNLSEPKFITEGAFDSMFLKNAIAVDGSNFQKAIKYIDKEKDILVYDNQNRNRELITTMSKMIDSGFRIFIWPKNIEEKDINEMIINGYTSEYIENMINKNNYSGLKLKLEFSQWRKI